MSKKILIVDDEPEIIDLVKNRLEANDYEVISATDGKEGIELAESENPDLIIMDIMMPNLSGGDAVKILKSKESTKNIPVLFLTGVFGKNDEGAATKGINVAGEYYKSISKPFKSEHLLAEIEGFLKDQN